MLEGGVNVVQRTRSTRSVFVRGARGAGVLRGGNAAEEFLEPSTGPEELFDSPRY